MPRLIPWTSSPAPPINNRVKTSTISRTEVSLWPTPTVSIITLLYPAASHKITASIVALATPPRVAAAGDGRTKALG